MKLPRENRPAWTTNIQWKGTDLCMDFWCPACGEYSHFDGFFAYAIKCSSCNAIYEMPTDVPLKRVESAEMVLCADPD